MCPKIADFGFCHTFQGDCLMSTPCGTVYYAAPELLQRETYDGRRVDVWALGVVLYVMVTGSLPWATDSAAHLCDDILHGELASNPVIRPELEELLKRMISVDPAARPSMNEIAENAWVTATSGPTLAAMAMFPSLFFPQAAENKRTSLRLPVAKRESNAQASRDVNGRPLRVILKKSPGHAPGKKWSSTASWSAFDHFQPSPLMLQQK
jgi:serine/threonine protein kinase